MDNVRHALFIQLELVIMTVTLTRGSGSERVDMDYRQVLRQGLCGCETLQGEGTCVLAVWRWE